MKLANRLLFLWREGDVLKLVSPAILFYAASFMIPMLCLFVLSFWRAQAFALIPAFTFDNYAKIAGSALHHTLLIRTVTLGFVTACIVLPLAFALAYLMRFVFERRAQLILQLILLSLFSGYLVRIYAWRTILGKQGLLNSMLQWLGVTDQPLEFLIYSNFAVVVTLTGLLLPLAVLPLYSAMSNVSREFLEAARDLGSSLAQMIRLVLIPLVMPGLRAAFAFTFFLAAGDFVTPALVGGAQSLMIGNVVADQFRGVGANWPLGAALAFVTILVVLLVYFAVMRLVQWATAQ
jgi:spermidine/putrescine transport system permease protein